MYTNFHQVSSAAIKPHGGTTVCNHETSFVRAEEVVRRINAALLVPAGIPTTCKKSFNHSERDIIYKIIDSKVSS